MATVLLVWELGASLGHVAPMRIIAQRLRSLGHRCVFVVRDLRAAEEVIEPELGGVMQAPLSMFRLSKSLAEELQYGYADLLHHCGFADVNDLAGRLRAWRQIFAEHRPAAVYLDHSPTALLAARSCNLPAVNAGTGFMVPPVVSPLRLFRTQPSLERNELLKREERVLAVINRALQRLKLPQLDSLQAMFDQQLPRILSYRELDHYGGDRSEPFIGTLDVAHGRILEWPQGPGLRVLAYLQRNKNLEAILSMLHRSKANVVVRIAGGTSVEGVEPYRRERMTITRQPINLRHLTATCHIVLNYASHGFVVDALRAGKPAVLLPGTEEQLLVARRVDQLGASLTAQPGERFDLPTAFARVREEPGFRTSAEAFAARYASWSVETTLVQLVDQPLRQWGI